jgi:hypothetical protein
MKRKKKKSKEFKKKKRYKPQEWMSEREYEDFLKELDKQRFEIESKIAISKSYRYVEIGKRLKKNEKRLKYIG